MSFTSILARNLIKSSATFKVVLLRVHKVTEMGRRVYEVELPSGLVDRLITYNI